MQRRVSPDTLAGILLAAGKGSRFDPTGAQDKLQQPLAHGGLVAASAAKSLLAVLPMVLAVVRPRSEQLVSALQALGCEVTECSIADDGMSASLVQALSHLREAQGWIIALADMPYVQPATIRSLADAVWRGAQIAAPIYQGRRGNPVAFGRAHLEALLQLRGDEGARRLLQAFPVVEIAVDDPGVVQDIDTADDLRIRR